MIGHRVPGERDHDLRNGAANAQAAFVVDDLASVRPWRVRCLEIRGEAEAIAHPVDSASRTSGAIIRLHPRRIINFGIDDDIPAAGARDVRSQAGD